MIQNVENWDMFLSTQKNFVNSVRELYEFEVLKDNDFFVEGITNFEEMSELWISSIGNILAKKLFQAFAKKKVIQKGIDKFYSWCIADVITYDKLYKNSPGFKFFIDEIPERIMVIFAKDQKAITRRRKTRKTIRAIRTVGISLATDKIIDSAFDLFGKRNLEDLYDDLGYNSFMYALGYSDYWK